MNIRYPIGKFEHVGETSSIQRDEWINEIGELPEKLNEAIKGLSEEQLTYNKTLL